MLLLIVHPPASVSLPLWFLTSWTRTTRIYRFLTVTRASRVTIHASSYPKTHLQADGEWLGTGSCDVELQDACIRMLVPGNLSSTLSC